MCRRVVFLCSVLQLLITANIVPSALHLSTLVMEAIRSSETSVPTEATRCHIPEYGIVHITLLLSSQVLWFPTNKECYRFWSAVHVRFREVMCGRRSRPVSRSDSSQQHVRGYLRSHSVKILALTSHRKHPHDFWFHFGLWRKVFMSILCRETSRPYVPVARR
jgi:hypothetical protein